MNLLTPDKKLYEAIVKLNTSSIVSILGKSLKKKYDNVIIEEDSDYIIAVGDIPIALVAHIDTVFQNPPNNIYYDPEAEMVWSPTGGIGDDRVGVFFIMKLLQQTKLRPYIFLMNDEEFGGLGAQSLIQNYPLCDWNINFFIELDRRGKDDAVFYNCNNREFIDFICAYGFKEQIGLFSDISVICPAWGIAGVNLSVGYENEHSVLEMWNVENGYNTYNKLLNILINEAPFFQYIAAPTTICDKCGMPIEIDEMIPVEVDEKNIKWYCINCLDEKNVNWCDDCGEAFIGTGKICRRCQWHNNEQFKKFKFNKA